MVELGVPVLSKLNLCYLVCWADPASNPVESLLIRLVVGQIGDNEAVLLSKKIAKEIEDRVQYPGEIKVSVIRESRSINYAR